MYLMWCGHSKPFCVSMSIAWYVWMGLSCEEICLTNMSLSSSRDLWNDMMTIVVRGSMEPSLVLRDSRVVSVLLESLPTCRSASVAMKCGSVYRTISFSRRILKLFFQSAVIKRVVLMGGSCATSPNIITCLPLKRFARFW